MCRGCLHHHGPYQLVRRSWPNLLKRTHMYTKLPECTLMYPHVPTTAHQGAKAFLRYPRTYRSSGTTHCAVDSTKRPAWCTAASRLPHHYLSQTAKPPNDSVRARGAPCPCEEREGWRTTCAKGMLSVYMGFLRSTRSANRVAFKLARLGV